MGRGMGMRRRNPRGRLRQEILRLLLDGPKHGYEMMQIISERSGGVWQPSPGSIYPTLSMLEDAGLVTVAESGGKKVYSLTAAGEQSARSLDAEGEETAGFDERPGLGSEISATFQALRQVQMVGTADQLNKSREMLTELRRGLYRLLAEDSEA
jgi:DNA-binding PadR family transcriptional regulator